MNETKARQLVTGRAQGRCELCARAETLTWAHRRNRSHGGAWTPANGLALCGSGTTGCHGWTEANPTAASLGGWRIIHDDSDPATIPVWLTNPWPGWWLLDDTGCYIGVDVDNPDPPATLPPWAPTSRYR